MIDPMTAAFDDPAMEELRQQCPVTRTAAGPWYLARYDDVLAATKDIEHFQASFREPGVVVPDEEQLINEIPEPRHGHVRRIINSAIAQHRIGRVEPFCVDLCHQLLDDLLATGGPVDLVADYVTPIPSSVIAHLLGAPPEDFAPVADVVRRGRAGHVPDQEPHRAGRGLRRRPPRVRDLRRRAHRRPAGRAARRLHHPAAADRGRRPPPHRPRGPHPAGVPVHQRQRDHPPPHRQPAVDPRRPPRAVRGAGGPTGSWCRWRSRSRCATTRPSSS